MIDFALAKSKIPNYLGAVLNCFIVAFNEKIINEFVKLPILENVNLFAVDVRRQFFYFRRIFLDLIAPFLDVSATRAHLVVVDAIGQLDLR